MMRAFAEPDVPIKIGVTTTTENSGLMDVLLPRFERTTKVPYHMLVAGTGAILSMAKRGDLDVMLVHSPDLEREFMRQGFGDERVEVMRNYYIVLGPKNDPAGIERSSDVIDALRRINQAHATFVSRSDLSGTHKKELELWAQAGLNPDHTEPFWYKKLGQGMGRTLYMASEIEAYLLSDIATYAVNQKKLDLRPYLKQHTQLLNPYSVITINPLLHKDILHKQAKVFVQWLQSSEAQELIKSFKSHDEQLFFIDP